MASPTLFEDERLTMAESIELSVESLRYYGSLYKHWVIAFSGGKDSSATVTLVAHLIQTGQIPQPECLSVIYADTRQELPPLHASALGILRELKQRGFDTRIVYPRLDHRFFVYMLGRGVPPPSNTFRWCTPKLKIMSMEHELENLRQERGEKFLWMTGVRIGESAARDRRIALSCSKDGGECGQGWFQHTSSAAVADVLAPLIHWRICNVWDWLMFEAPGLGFPTEEVALVYGMSSEGTEKEEPLNLRTGCIGCPLVEEDRALETVIKSEGWEYLAPLRKLRPLYREMKKPHHRLRKFRETNKDGTLAAKQGRLGPLHMEARQHFLEQILQIQTEVNQAATALNQSEVSLINPEELARIYELIEANTWPDKWDGTEYQGDKLLPHVLPDGSEQLLLFDEI
ncbi:MAG: phosphoadenosine phosphosulfate reductase family protein [Microcoleaceae cyanobacterium]